MTRHGTTPPRRWLAGLAGLLIWTSADGDRHLRHRPASPPPPRIARAPEPSPPTRARVAPPEVPLVVCWGAPSSGKPSFRLPQ